MKKLAKEMDFIGDDGKPDVKELIDYINKTRLFYRYDFIPLILVIVRIGARYIWNE